VESAEALEAWLLSAFEHDLAELLREKDTSR